MCQQNFIVMHVIVIEKVETTDINLEPDECLSQKVHSFVHCNNNQNLNNTTQNPKKEFAVLNQPIFNSH